MKNPEHEMFKVERHTDQLTFDLIIFDMIKQLEIDGWQLVQILELEKELLAALYMVREKVFRKDGTRP